MSREGFVKLCAGATTPGDYERLSSISIEHIDVLEELLREAGDTVATHVMQTHSRVARDLVKRIDKALAALYAEAGE